MTVGAIAKECRVSSNNKVYTQVSMCEQLETQYSSSLTVASNIVLLRKSRSTNQNQSNSHVIQLSLHQNNVNIRLLADIVSKLST